MDATSLPPGSPRQRFRETMRGGRPDRLPLFEEGIRDEVLAEWRRQGLPAATDIAEVFTYDRREMVPLSLEPRPPLDAWPQSRRDLAELQRRLDPDDPGRLPADWAQRLATWRGREHLLQLPIHRGFFLSLGVNDWHRFTEVVYLLEDDPALVEGIMDMYSHCYTRLVQRILPGLDVDFVTFSEPIGGNDGPLLSPAQYERFVLRYYRPIVDALRRAGVETVVFLTYANARVLLPRVLDAGFNCLWACETEPHAMDYRSIRRQFGDGVGLIGGIDLDVLLADRATIRRELSTRLPPLLAQGRFIPLADGRVRSGVTLANYTYYRQRLEAMVTTPPRAGPRTDRSRPRGGTTPPVAGPAKA